MSFARSRPSASALLKGLAVVALVCGLVALWQSGELERFTPERLRDDLLALGPWGGAVFVLLVSVLQPIGVSIHLLLFAGAMVWSPPVAVLLGWLGSVGSGVTAYFFARGVAREAVQSRLPERARVYDERLATDGFRTVLIIRLMFFTTPVVQYMLGVSRVRFGAFLAGTAIGNLPSAAFSVLMGGAIGRWLNEHPPSTWPWWAWVALGALALAVVGGMLWRRQRQREG